MDTEPKVPALVLVDADLPAAELYDRGLSDEGSATEIGAPRPDAPIQNGAAGAITPEQSRTWPGIASLKQISIEGLRQRTYSSTLKIEQQLGDELGLSPYSQCYGPPYYNTYIASYRSDELRVYTRVDVPPTPAPASGYPVIIYGHGWVGAGGAQAFKFDYTANGQCGDILDAWTKAGFIVLMPGFRGHGTVNGVPAEGLEWVQAYDNGSYLSPIFYAIDILNLLEGAGTLNAVDWTQWGYAGSNDVRVDTGRIFLTGHSQGGDAALTALAVSGSRKLHNTFSAASIWNGCFEGRVEQGAFYGPQENASATKSDPAYFPYMPSWWCDSSYCQTIEEALACKKQQMYDTVRTYVADQRGADPAANSLIAVMATLDAFKYPWHITAPVDLHFSDMDHYSIPSWNAGLVRMVRAAGGKANAYLYKGNSHELKTVAGWSPDGSVSGRRTAIGRTLALFSSIP